ncbi:hypothetical protein GPALN_010909 [Globodera pallida]|nr:hypothetical protein GPALN_010909 [Globodera pallida]
MVLSPNRVCPMKIVFDHKYLQNKSASGYDEAAAQFDGIAYVNMLVSLANLIPNFYGIKFRIAEIEFDRDCSSLATCNILPTERNYVNIFHEQLQSHNWEKFCSVIYIAHGAQFWGFNGKNIDN